MSDGFYRAFEERYYAPREHIKDLRRQYLPFITPLSTAYPGSPVFDIGCGRGEWLELMAERGFLPYGVDLDQGMLNACFERDIPAEQGDAIAFLQTLENESQAVVSAFHVVEHITFDQLRTLVSEALRVLKPGGLLIMETPNPENIAVATRNFYLDPTHQRPIPSGLLSFLPEYCGFLRTKVLRLQEKKSLAESAEISLLNVLNDVSPDYAVVAQKAGSDALTAVLNGTFSAEYGVGLDSLAVRYNDQISLRFKQMDTVLRQFGANIQQLEAKAYQAESKVQQAEARIHQSEARINALLNSTSWRVTAPLRAMAEGVYQFKAPVLKQRIRLVLQHAALYVGRRPWLRRTVHRVLAHCPGVRSRLIRAVQRTSAGYQAVSVEVPTELAQLTLHARSIHADLVSAIQKRNTGES